MADYSAFLLNAREMGVHGAETVIEASEAPTKISLSDVYFH